MTIDTELVIPMAVADKDFSAVVKKVEDKGTAIIVQSNRPELAVLTIEEYTEYLEIKEQRRKELDEIAKKVFAEDAEALRELAK